MMQEFIRKLVEGGDLTPEEAGKAMEAIMAGSATPAQTAAFLTALRLKGETVEEIAAFAKVMRSFADCIEPKVGPLVDTCGTGGDRCKTFNISTVTAFVMAGAGVSVAKHGNRSVTSKCGSADLLEALGVRIDLPPKAVERVIEEVGIGFMFAPTFHRAMKHAAGVRKEIGIRTVFNILGPLTNPAGARAQLLGVYDPGLTEKMALVLRSLGSERALVVHGIEGLDEISISGETRVSELKDGEVRSYALGPREFGFEQCPIGRLEGGDPQANAATALAILQGEKGPRRDVVVLNAAAGIYVGGLARSIKEGIPLAEGSIDSGKAYGKLKVLIERTKS